MFEVKALCTLISIFWPLNCTVLLEREKINKFLDISNDFLLNNYKLNKIQSDINKNPSINALEVPIYFSWADHGAVSPAKDQGKCEACWAFTVIASLESHFMIYRNQKEILSEQFLIDCLTRRKGCEPDSVQSAYADIITEFGGVVRESDYYPYTGQRETCKWPKYSNHTETPGKVPQGIIPVVGFRKVRQDEDEMAKLLAKK